MLGSHAHCRAIRYELHYWPFVADRGNFLKFQVLIRGDASYYVLIRIVALWYGKVRIDKFQVTRYENGSDTITYVLIRLSRSSLRFELDLIMIRVPDLGRSCTFVSRTAALCCNRIRLWSRCLSRSGSKMITVRVTVGLGQINRLTIDFIFFTIYKVNNSTHNHWKWRKLGLMTTWHL